MRILIKQSSNPSVNHFFGGIARTLIKADVSQPITWNPKFKPSFDAFDELKPDIFFASEYDLNKSDLKCLSEYKQTIFGLHRRYNSDWSAAVNPDVEFQFVRPALVQGKAISLPCAVDLLDKPPVNMDAAFALSAVATSEKFEQYLRPLCAAELGTNISIFSEKDLGIPQYFGRPTDMASIYAKSYLSIIFGDNKYESNHKIYDCVKYCGLPLTEYNETDQDILQSTFPSFQNTDDIVKWLKYYGDYSNHRVDSAKLIFSQCMEHHTYFERASVLFDGLGLSDIAEAVRNSK